MWNNIQYFKMDYSGAIYRTKVLPSPCLLMNCLYACHIYWNSRLESRTYAEDYRVEGSLFLSAMNI